MPRLITSHPARQSLRALLNGFSQIFLQQHPGCGLLVLIAILIGAPDLLPGALLGGLTSMLLAQRRGYPPANIAIGLYGYYGILLGLLQPGFSALGLPALTMPFILACWLIRAGAQSWQKAVKDSTPTF
ncbi:hypothetical protein EQ826_15870 [Ectopseudomonas mendocina]|nr:hypothetical protein EQ828_14965 [Pseudomonas mendocina]TRO24927.1 hypothetical protein EQ826_15870 [Pseudomonas mendocina]